MSDHANGLSCWVRSRYDLECEVKRLRDERALLVSDLVELRSAADYGQETGDIAIFRRRYKAFKDGRASQILFVHCAEDEHYAFVDGGYSEGVSEGMLVLDNNNLMGRVSEAFAHYSKVILLTDRRMKVAGYCSKTKVRGIVEGANKACINLKFVAHTKHLRVDDLVISSGQGITYPRGLCLGKIIDFIKGPVEYEIVVQPLFDISILSFCLLINAHDVH